MMTSLTVYVQVSFFFAHNVMSQYQQMVNYQQMYPQMQQSYYPYHQQVTAYRSHVVRRKSRRKHKIHKYHDRSTDCSSSDECSSRESESSDECYCNYRCEECIVNPYKTKCCMSFCQSCIPYEQPQAGIANQRIYFVPYPYPLVMSGVQTEKPSITQFTISSNTTLHNTTTVSNNETPLLTESTEKSRKTQKTTTPTTPKTTTPTTPIVPKLLKIVEIITTSTTPITTTEITTPTTNIPITNATTTAAPKKKRRRRLHDHDHHYHYDHYHDHYDRHHSHEHGNHHHHNNNDKKKDKNITTLENKEKDKLTENKNATSTTSTIQNVEKNKDSHIDSTKKYDPIQEIIEPPDTKTNQQTVKDVHKSPIDASALRDLLEPPAEKYLHGAKPGVSDIIFKVPGKGSTKYILTSLRKVKQNWMPKYGIVPIPDTVASDLMTQLRSMKVLNHHPEQKSHPVTKPTELELANKLYIHP